MKKSVEQRKPKNTRLSRLNLQFQVLPAPGDEEIVPGRLSPVFRVPHSGVAERSLDELPVERSMPA